MTRTKRGADNKKRPSPFWRQLDQVVLIGLFSAIFIAVRIAWVSNGNSAVAKILLQNADPLKMFMSSVIPNIGLLALVATYFGTTRSGGKFKFNSAEYWVRHTALSLLLLIGIGLVNRRGAVVVAVFLLFKFFVYLIHRFKISKFNRLEEFVSDRETVANWAMYSLFFLLIIPNAVWLSTENIVLNDNTQLTGYVLATDTNFVTVLTTTSEDIKILKVKDIASRQVCSSNSDFRPIVPFFRSVNRRTSIPECWK